MNSRRLIASPEAKDRASYRQKLVHWKGPPMSALGQKQTYALHKGMSALPPIATAKAESRKRSCLLYRGHQWETSAIALATPSAKSANFRDRAPCMKSSRRPLVISSWTPAPRRPLLQILLLLVAA